MNEILQTDSLSLLDSSLNVFSNSREKSYFAVWVDFDHQCFAEWESILNEAKNLNEDDFFKTEIK